MEEHIEFNPSFTMLTLALAPGESVKAEAGAMVCQSGVEMTTAMSGGGGPSAQQPPKRKMKGPEIDLDDIPDHSK